MSSQTVYHLRQQSHRKLFLAILLAMGTISALATTSHAAENIPSPVSSRTNLASPQIAQNPDPERERQLERQREAERVLKEGERLKRELRENGADPSLRREVDEQVTKVRESGSDRRKVQQADRELDRLREQNNRSRYNYQQFGYPYDSTPSVIFIPGGAYGEYQIPAGGTEIQVFPQASLERSDGVSSYPATAKNSNFTQILTSVGLKNGTVSPSIGMRYNNLGLELGAIFNQDSLPSTPNDFALPSNFLFNDLGTKKLSPQWGADVLGFVDINPRIALYGSVGVYFQSLSRIAQSQATNELYKQTDETNVAGAIGGGMTYKATDSISIGAGYHSLRGITANVGIKF